MRTLLPIIIVSVIVLLLVVITYNRLVRALNMVREAWSGIDVQLKRRYDLIPNLVAAVRGYAEYERSVQAQLAALRAPALDSAQPHERGSAENELSRSLKGLFALAEAYPQLQASEQFLNLQRELAAIEDQVQFARRYYNGSVRDYNILIHSFPSNLIAGLFHFTPREYFELELVTERKPPVVDTGQTS